MLTALLVTTLLALTPPPEPPSKDAPPTGCMEPFEKTPKFCDGRVYPAGGGGHISWTAYCTTAEPEIVKGHYMKRCGRANYKPLKTMHDWRFPKDEATKIVSVAAADQEGPWTTCKVPEGANTVVMLIHLPR